jgi:tetratricopeptide (TPR) repeat protein
LVLLGVGSVLGWQWPAPGDSIGRIALESLAVSAALGALCTLVPYSSRGHASDGLGLLASLFVSPDTLRQRLCWPFIADARRHLLREQVTLAEQRARAGLEQFPDDPRLLGLLAVCSAAAGAAQPAFEQLEALGPPENQVPVVRADVLADATWSVLFAERVDLYSDAQRAVQQAIELVPDLHYQVLLGRIHLEQGRAEAAYTQLMAAYKGTSDVDQETQCVAYLALCCAALAQAENAPTIAGYGPRFLHAALALDLPPALRQRIESLRQQAS